MRSGFAAMTARTVLATAGAMSLAACANAIQALGPATVDPASPMAAKVAAASRADLKTPRFRDVPPVPTNVPGGRTVRADVNRVLAAGEGLQAYVAANPAPQADTEAFAARARARIPDSERAPQAADAESGTETLAERLRAIATPPPSPR